MQNDDALYDEYLSGSAQAFDALVIRYGDSLTVFLYGYLHNWQDAEDMMVEAFARIMSKKPLIRAGRFKAYLFKTARNLAARFHSTDSGEKRFSLDGLEDVFPDLETPEELIQNQERSHILHLCLERIEPELREALWLVYFDGMQYKEAAVVMKVTARRIERLLTRGKAALRTELEKEGITNAYE